MPMSISVSDRGIVGIGLTVNVDHKSVTVIPVDHDRREDIDYLLDLVSPVAHPECIPLIHNYLEGKVSNVQTNTLHRPA